MINVIQKCKILKGVLLLRKCGNHSSTKEEQIREQINWLEKGYLTEHDLDEWIADLKDELSKLPEQKEAETKERIQKMIESEITETASTCNPAKTYASSTSGDYSPSCPWNAPGMSIKDFI